jgi:hypothetical protein
MLRTCSHVVALAAMVTCGLVTAQAHGCTRDHELHRIVPEYRAIILDGGDIKRVMYVDWQDDRLKSWKPGHNITFCPDENKVINTTINSVATLLSEFATTCKTLLISNTIDRALQSAWDYANSPNGDPSVFLTEAKSQLVWYYKVCTDHGENWFDKEDFKNFLSVAASLMRVNMAIEDPANESTYKARAAQSRNGGTLCMRPRARRVGLGESGSA